MKIVHVGWCREGTHDKVWGVICLDDIDNTYIGRYKNKKLVKFWGRRGSLLQTKICENTLHSVEREFRKKLDKGYKAINIADLDTVYPEFHSDLEKTTFWSILKA